MAEIYYIIMLAISILGILGSVPVLFYRVKQIELREAKYTDALDEWKKFEQAEHRLIMDKIDKMSNRLEIKIDSINSYIMDHPVKE